MKFAPVLVLIACLCFAGCEESSESGATSSVPAMNSGVQGVPIPKSAEPVKNRPLLGDDWWFVPSMSFTELVDWYEVELPVGENFKQWQWCDVGGTRGSPDGFSLIYSKGKNEIMAVTLVGPDDPDPPAVNVGVDNSGPC